MKFAEMKTKLEVFDYVMFKPGCSATETSLKLKILHMESLDIARPRENNRGVDQTAWIRRLI